MNKLFPISLGIVFLLTLVVSPAFAIEKPGSDRAMNGASKAAEKKQEAQDRMEEKAADRTGSLQERADKEISRRIESLTKLLDRITEFKKLSATQKTSLTAQVQAEIDKLTELQEKIAAETDAATIKTDVQSIVTSYRIYALFMPKVHILGAADRILTIAGEMSTHAAALEVKIADAKTKGNDTTELETLLSDMEGQITDANIQAQKAIDTVTSLTPEGYPDNKTELQSAREMVATGIKDLNTARQYARKIIVGLMKFGKIGSDQPEKPTKAPEPTETP